MENTEIGGHGEHGDHGAMQNRLKLLNRPAGLRDVLSDLNNLLASPSFHSVTSVVNP